MYIQTQSTPNPNALKFILDSETGLNSVYYASSDAADSIISSKIFAISGIKSLFFGNDFITVTKDDDATWDTLKSEVIICMMDCISSGTTFLEACRSKESPVHNVYEEYDEIEKQIIEVIETMIQPSVAMDGGHVAYKGFENGIVKLEMTGACSGCPSSSVTLKRGIESTLKRYIPEVIEVVQV